MRNTAKTLKAHFEIYSDCLLFLLFLCWIS